MNAPNFPSMIGCRLCGSWKTVNAAVAVQDSLTSPTVSSCGLYRGTQLLRICCTGGERPQEENYQKHNLARKVSN
jgi:hypothetical protein